MNWDLHRERLSEGKSVQFRPKGNSMKPRINSGELVTVEPVDAVEIEDAVFCKVGGNYYVHLIKAIKEDRYLIGNNRGGTNGWCSRANIFGRVTKVELSLFLS